MDTITNAAKQVSQTVQGTGSEASKEANKHVAKDGNNSLGTRAEAAKDAVGDKIDSKKHETKANVYEEKAKH